MVPSRSAIFGPEFHKSDVIRRESAGMAACFLPNLPSLEGSRSTLVARIRLRRRGGNFGIRIFVSGSDGSAGERRGHSSVAGDP